MAGCQSKLNSPLDIRRSCSRGAGCELSRSNRGVGPGPHHFRFGDLHQAPSSVRAGSRGYVQLVTALAGYAYDSNRCSVLSQNCRARQGGAYLRCHLLASRGLALPSPKARPFDHGNQTQISPRFVDDPRRHARARRPWAPCTVPQSSLLPRINIQC